MPPPARGRRNPALLAPDGDAGPQVAPDPIDEAEQASADEPGAEGTQPPLMYDGELLQTSMTLAVVLPGDSKESYFGSRGVFRLQTGEDADDLAARAITVVRSSVLNQLDDAIDAVAEYMTQLVASGRVPHA